MTVDINKIKQEQIVFLRNQDIFSTTDRGVTTTSQSGTLSDNDTITIARTNVKNIRSLRIGSINVVNLDEVTEDTVGDTVNMDDGIIKSVFVDVLINVGAVTVVIEGSSNGTNWVSLNSQSYSASASDVYTYATYYPYMRTRTESQTNATVTTTITGQGEIIKQIGSGYEADYNHATGCVITLTTSQTGTYEVYYDYGSDKIYPDFPRDDLAITSYPRIAMDILNVSTEAFGLGGKEFISNIAFTVIVYADSTDELDTYIQAIRTAYLASSKSFYYMGFVKPTLIGPTIDSPGKKSEIMSKNIDFLGMFEVDG
jgi:hypothetical protein